MKLIIKLFLLSTFVVGNSFNTFSQEVKDKETTEKVQQKTPDKSDIRTDTEIAEEHEVRKFVDSFIKVMDEKKDIKKVPEKFFVLKFKETFAKNSEWLDHISDNFRVELLKESHFETLYAGNTNMFNFIFLQMMCMSGNNIGPDSDSETKEDTNDDSDGGSIKKILPSSVIDLMRANTRLAEIFDLNDLDEEKSKEFQTLIEINNFNSDLNRINTEITKHVESQPASWHETYQKRAAEYRIDKIYYDYDKNPCKDEDCKGLPANTVMYEFTSFPLVFQLVNESDSYKILDIYILSN